MMRIFIWALIAVVLAVAAFLAVCLPDEDLTPEAKALLEFRPKVSAPPEKNGYYLAMGRLAPVGEDAHAWGRRRVLALVQADKRGTAPHGAEQGAAAGQELTVAPFPCKDQTGDCLEMIRTQRKTLDAWLASHAELMARYRKLREYPAFQTDYFPTRAKSAIPSYGGSYEALATAVQIAALVVDGKAAAALDEMAQEIALHQHMLASAPDLLQKLIAAGLLTRDFKLLSALMTDYRSAMTPQLGRVAGLARPLSAEELDTATVIRVEMGASARFMRDPADWCESLIEFTKWTGKPDTPLLYEPLRSVFYRPNATINLWAKSSEVTLNFAKAPAIDLVARKAALEAELDAQIRVFNSPYNMTGRITLGRQISIYPPEYSFRIHNLNGLIRLVALQAQIMAKGVRAPEIPQAIARAGKEYFDPYTEKPMQWDSAKRQVYFMQQIATWASRDDRFEDKSGRLAVKLP